MIRRWMDGARRGSGSALLLSARYWAGGRLMRSECIAALPQSTCCYTWKLPVTPHMRPVLFDQANDIVSRASAKLRRGTCRAEHPSIPWKAYLASREFQNLASDMADAVFSPASSFSSSELERPSSLKPCALTRAAGKPAPGSLLASVLQDAGDAPRDNAEKQAPGLALAA